MSRFLSDKYRALRAYTPGEQPRDRRYIKLNTNESPFPPPPSVLRAVSEEAERVQLYCDPTCSALVQKAAELYGVSPDMLLMTNGSDEILQYAFMAFGDTDRPFAFPDLTYGFYPVFAELNGIPYEEIPLNDDFTINVDDYIGIGKNIFIANPNAPTGIALPLSDIERIVASNPDNIVVIDEAYVDFGAESAAPLTRKYNNLIVTQTFSKSRSMAGARLGFGIASPDLIRDMNTVKYSTNPYNVNSMTMAAGIGALSCEDYTRKNCKTVMENRDFCTDAMQKMGFVTTDSKTNFIFAKHPAIDGGVLYTKLRERGILVRHFNTPIIAQYNRITVGTREQMQALLCAMEEILEENKQ